jgi:hypothetical protein
MHGIFALRELLQQFTAVTIMMTETRCKCGCPRSEHFVQGIDMENPEREVHVGCMMPNCSCGKFELPKCWCCGNANATETEDVCEVPCAAYSNPRRLCQRCAQHIREQGGMIPELCIYKEMRAEL